MRSGPPRIRLLYRIGRLVVGATTSVTVLVDDDSAGAQEVEYRWVEDLEESAMAFTDVSSTMAGVEVSITITAPAVPGRYALEIDNREGIEAGRAPLRVSALVDGPDPVRRLVTSGLEPMSYAWGTDRGQPIHRLYLERFLEEHRGDIRGVCLEFQNPQYVPRFGGDAVRKLDILHADASNPLATLVADLTERNHLPSAYFDCIVCTHVLHVIEKVERAVEELHRILRPGGVLLVAVPHVSMYDDRYGELWRFTPEGLRAVLTASFRSELVSVHGYGNSLTAAGEIRGLVASEFSPEELNVDDAGFAVEVCARAVRDR